MDFLSEFVRASKHRNDIKEMTLHMKGTTRRCCHWPLWRIKKTLDPLRELKNVESVVVREFWAITHWINERKKTIRKKKP